MNTLKLRCRSSGTCSRIMVWTKRGTEWSGVCGCGYSSRAASGDAFALDAMLERGQS